MKRVRAEQIQYTVAQYLKRRQYVDTESSVLKGARLFQSAEEMAANLTVQTESGCVNIVAAAPTQSDPQQYEIQFSRLRSFLSETELPWAKEVSGLLYPLFVYLHLDMVRCGLKGAVDGFYGRFHGAFLQDAEQRATVELLRHVLTLQDATASPRLAALLEHKYVVHFSEPAHSYLLRYLQSEDNGALCRALSAHVQVEVTASQRTDYQLYGGAGVTAAGPDSSSTPGGGGPRGGPAERGGPGGAAGLRQEGARGAAVAHHRLLLRLPPHGAAAEHGRGVRRQPAAGRRVRQLGGEAVEPPRPQAEGQAAPRRRVADPPGLRPAGGRHGRGGRQRDQDAARPQRPRVPHGLPDGRLRPALLLRGHLGALLGPGHLRQHGALPGPRLPRVGRGREPLQPLLRQRLARPQRAPLDLLAHLPAAPVRRPPGGRGLRQVPPQLQLPGVGQRRQDGAPVEHPAGGDGAPVHGPPGPRVVAGLLARRQVPGVGGRGPAGEAVGPVVGHAVQGPAGPHGRRARPVLQPRQQPGGVGLRGQHGPRVGRPQRPRCPPRRRDHPPRRRRLVRRAGGALHREHGQPAERPVHGLQPAAGDRHGAGEDGTVVAVTAAATRYSLRSPPGG